MANALPFSTVRELKSRDAAGNAVFASVLVVRKLTAKTASNGKIGRAHV